VRSVARRPIARGAKLSTPAEREVARKITYYVENVISSRVRAWDASAQSQ
jgi:hypothetical protein